MNKQAADIILISLKAITQSKKLKTARWDLCLLISIKLQRQKTKQIHNQSASLFIQVISSVNMEGDEGEQKDQEIKHKCFHWRIGEVNS